MNAATSGPIEKAAVRIYSLERNWDQATLSDSAGRFVFRDVPPGRYQLQADARGYITKAFGEQYFGGGGAEMRLPSGAHPRDVLFRLTPAAVITGTVRDADSTPVMDASVAAVHPGYFQNRRQFFQTGQGKTDDRGEYRIYPLLPGKYTVVVNYRGGGEDRYVTYLPTFYPGTADPNEARWIDVAPGQEISEIDISLTSVRAACVRGRVTNLVPSKNSTVPYVELHPIGTPLNEQLLMGRYGATAMNDHGEFEICGVPPGAYIADANFGNGEKQYIGHATVDVVSTGANDVTIPLNMPFEIRGLVRTDAQGSFEFSKVEVWLRSKGSPGGAAGKMKSDGSFVIHDVYEGNYWLQIAGYPEDSYVKSARWGGTDVLAGGLTADQGQSSQVLEVLLSANGGRIDGFIVGGSKPVQGTSVAFVPDSAHREQDELYRLTTTDGQGRFSLFGLPPGDFTLYAFEKINPFLLRDPDFLQQYARYAKPVHVEEKQRQTVELELAPSREDSNQ